MLKNTRKLKISTLFIIYLLSNLLMLVIPGVTILLYNKELQRTMSETADSVNQQMARQFQLVMDSALGEIDSIYRTLYTDAQIEAYLYKSGPLTDKDYYDGYELINRLSAIAQTKSAVSDFFVFFPNSDAVITPGYRLKSTIHYNRLLNIPGMDYETWMDSLLIDGKNFRALKAMEATAENAPSSSESIFLLRKLYLTSSDQLNPVLCCVINPRDIKSRLDFLGEDNDFAMLMRDYTGEVIFRLGSAPATLAPLEINASHLGAKYELYLNSVGSSSASSASGFNLIFTVLAFSISVLLAFLLAYRNYSPIRLIASQLEHSAPPKGVSNELKNLASSVEQALKNNWALESELQKMEPIYINHILSDLLRGNAPPASGASELLKKAGVDLRDRTMYVVQVLVWDPGKYDYQGGEQGLVQAMIVNAAAKSFKGVGDVHAIYSGESGFFLIIALNRKDASAQIEPLLNQVCQIFSQDIGVSLCLACSGPVGDIDSLAIACTQAQSAAELADFTAPVSVIVYRKDRKSRLRDMHFPIDEELKILNAVRSGNSEQASKLVGDIIDENLFERVLDVVSIRFLLLNLGGTLIQCAQQLHYDLSTAMDDFAHLMDDLHSAQEIKDYFVERFVMLAEYAYDRKNGRHRVLTEKIIALVEESYADSELSVSSLAEQAGLTPYYLSSIFKEHTGFNISYYIHQVRIKHAKKLLEDPSLTINTIAQMTGYLSDVSFIRTFKRYEGITPGAYRDSRRSFPSS
ncbi:MAG: helix-turn-helix transcriptional regulator [Christensenellales bacterium]|jgi:two-component system response regulator YesN